MLLIKESQVKKYIKAVNPDLRIAKEAMLAIDKQIRDILDKSIALPTNKKTLRDIIL